MFQWFCGARVNSSGFSECLDMSCWRRKSKLSQCLWEASDGEEKNIFLISNIPAYFKCMKVTQTKEKSLITLNLLRTIKMKFLSRGEDMFSFGWDMPFTYQSLNNNSITLPDDHFVRYENSFSNMEWVDKVEHGFWKHEYCYKWGLVINNHFRLFFFIKWTFT